MRLRTRLLLLTAVSTLPFLAALPWALRVFEASVERELDARLERAEGAARASLAELGAGVERTVRELANQASVEELARGLQAGSLESADLVGAGEPLMAVAGLDALELVDAQGRVLSSGHLPARAGDPDPDALALARSGAAARAQVRRIELRSPAGIVPALVVLAARPVRGAEGTLFVVGGRAIGLAWARGLSEVTGAAVAVEMNGREVARTGNVPEPRQRRVALASAPAAAGAMAGGGDGAAVGAEVRLELSAEGLRAARARLVRGAVLLWGALLLAALGLGLLFASRITRPVAALAQGARALARGELGREVDAPASGELGELVEAFNAMSRGLKTATERAAVAERVAAWQGVARRLAHEIKNPLTPIRMSMETLVAAQRAGRPDFDALFSESARAVLEEVERLRRIVDEFSRFARLPKPRLSEEDLSQLAASVLALYATPRAEVIVEAQLSAAPLPVLADRDQIAQVLINLLANAEQAMPSGGRIVLRTGIAGDEPYVEVEDQGPGVPEAHRARLFEPYFTTKEGGTGLGLAIALRIAQEHGGRLEELGRPGEGAQFRLTLPAGGRAGVSGLTA